MTRLRVPETDLGIQGQFTVDICDLMQRRLRDKGWIETRDIKEDLMADWKLAVAGEPVFKIDPLK